jgi:hypothetical protein
MASMNQHPCCLRFCLHLVVFMVQIHTSASDFKVFTSINHVRFAHSWVDKKKFINKIIIYLNSTTFIYKITKIALTKDIICTIKTTRCKQNLRQQGCWFIDAICIYCWTAVNFCNFIDTCKHFEIGSGSVRSLRHLPVFVIEHLWRDQHETNKIK